MFKRFIKRNRFLKKKKEKYCKLVDEIKKANTDGKGAKEIWRESNRVEKLEILSGGLIILSEILFIVFIIFLVVRFIIKVIDFIS